MVITINSKKQNETATSAFNLLVIYRIERTSSLFRVGFGCFRFISV